VQRPAAAVEAPADVLAAGQLTMLLVLLRLLVIVMRLALAPLLPCLADCCVCHHCVDLKLPPAGTNRHKHPCLIVASSVMQLQGQQRSQCCVCGSGCVSRTQGPSSPVLLSAVVVDGVGHLKQQAA
jgi:hypothetical protein